MALLISTSSPTSRRHHTEYVGIRLPAALVADLRRIAARESNQLAPVFRRLLSIGLEFERRAGGLR